MGQQLNCNKSDQILKHYSIHNEGQASEDRRKKIHPLQYIQPIKFKTEDAFTSNFDWLSKSYKEDKEAGEAAREKGAAKGKEPSLCEAEMPDIIECQDQKQNEDVNIVKVKWNKFIKMKNRNFQQDYRIISEIGRGGFGCVYKAVMRNGQIERAAKKINKDKLKKDEHENLLAEMAIMMSLDHPNITKLYEVYDQKTHYIMVLELCEGGELFERIINRNIRESEARNIMGQLLNALNYIHEKGIAHRDIKPENVLFEKKTKLVKIIDFGISKRVKPGEHLNTRVGTPYYIAPEVLYRKYNEKCDIWSLGVVLYMIVFNYPPFKGSDAAQVMENIVKDEISFKNNYKTKFSQSSIDFLKSLLTKDPEARPSAKEALEHPWLKEKKRSSKSDSKDREEILERISNFHFKDKLQAVVHTYIVSQLLTSEERIELLDVFRELDSNNNGIIDSEQIKQALLRKNFQKIDEKKIKRIFDYIDTNCSGHIDYTEFLVAAIDFPKKVTEKHFEQAFQYFDIDNSGEITFEEVVKFLENEIESREEIKKMFMTVDKNGDGVISKSEFVELLVQQQGDKIGIQAVV